MADVKIKLPTGEVGSIPEENLPEALKRGAIVVTSSGSGTLDKAISTGKSIAKGAVESGTDLASGLAQGATLGGPGPAMGAISALGGLATGQVGSTDDLVARYKQYRDIMDKQQAASKARSPYLYGTGELAGTVGTAALTGGAALEEGIASKLAASGITNPVAKTAIASGIASAPFGAAQGALSSPEDSSKEEIGKEALEGAASGGILGAGIGGAVALGKAGIGAAGKAIDKYRQGITTGKGSPLPREMEAAYTLGEQGKNPTNQTDYMGSLDSPESTKTPLIQEPAKDADKLVNLYYNGDEFLSKNVGAAVDAFVDETGKAKPLNVSDTIKNKTLDFIKYFDKNPSIGLNDDAKAVITELQNLSVINPTASAVMDTRNNLYKMASQYKVDSPFVANEASDIANKLGQNLKEQVPGYKEASQRLADYRHLLGEGVLSGDVPLKYSQDYISQMKDADTKLLTNFKKIIQTVNTPGTSGEIGQEAFSNFLTNMKALQEKDPKIFDTLGINPSGLENFIQKSSDRAAAVSTIRGNRLNPAGTTGSAEGLVKGITGAGRTALVSGSRYLGAAKKTIADLSQSLSKATDQQLLGLSDKLPAPIRSSLVKSIENKDVVGKNAAVFTIMQNPEYRKLINIGDVSKEESEDTEE